MVNQKFYHIYLEDKCLFKDLSEEEFEIIWEKIYKSYFTKQLTYLEMTENRPKEYEESSY